MSSELRKGRHVVYQMHCHLVFLPKYRKNVFTDAILTDMHNMFRVVCADFETDLLEFNGESDHVHLLVRYPPKIAVASLVNSLKGVSSRKLRKNHPFLEKKYSNGGLWSPSYYAGSVGGAPIAVVRQYIESQTRPLSSPS